MQLANNVLYGAAVAFRNLWRGNGHKADVLPKLLHQRNIVHCEHKRVQRAHARAAHAVHLLYNVHFAHGLYSARFIRALRAPAGQYQPKLHVVPFIYVFTV